MKAIDLPEICTPDQIANYLGVHRNTVYNWCNAGDLPSFKLKGARRVRKKELLEWVDMQEQTSLSPAK